MARLTDPEHYIGRRLRLRDLHVFMIVAHSGSMAKAATQLGVSQPAVTEVIAGLEHALRVHLFDRSPRGVELTLYGRALLKRGVAAFDELKQGVRDIESLADPAVGELRIGCSESIFQEILPPVVKRFTEKFPRVVLHVEQVVTPTLDLPQLRERSLDLIISRVNKPLTEDPLGDDLNVEMLFEDRLVLAAGMHTQWARRRHIDLAELIDEPWILPPPNSWNWMILAEACQAKGLKMPKVNVFTFSIHLRIYLLANGPFITGFPSSALSLNAGRSSPKVLPVDLPVRPWPVAIVTLKNRTLSPIVQVFIEHVRANTRSMAAPLLTDKAPRQA